MNRLVWKPNKSKQNGLTLAGICSLGHKFWPFSLGYVHGCFGFSTDPSIGDTKTQKSTKQRLHRLQLCDGQGPAVIRFRRQNHFGETKLHTPKLQAKHHNLFIPSSMDIKLCYFSRPWEEPLKILLHCRRTKAAKVQNIPAHMEFNFRRL